MSEEPPREEKELYNSIRLPREIVLGDILYYCSLLGLSVLLFAILMIIRAQTKSTIINKDEGEEEFFVDSEPDYSNWIELVGQCSAIAGKFPKNNKDIETVSMTGDIPTVTDTEKIDYFGFYTSYKSLVHITPSAVRGCALTLVLKREDDDVFERTVKVPAESTSTITFATSYGSYQLYATPDDEDQTCEIKDAEIVVENRTVDFETVQAIECPDNICSFYGFYLITREEGAEECYAISHQSVFPVPIFLLVFCVLCVPACIHLVVLLHPPNPFIRWLRQKSREKAEEMAQEGNGAPMQDYGGSYPGKPKSS